MLLPGKVELWALGDVLGAIHRSGLCGTLTLTETTGRRAGTPHHVYFVAGAPRAVASDGPRLGEVMRGAGAVRAREVDLAIFRQQRGDRRLFGELIREVGSPSAEAVAAGLRTQTRERLDRLFSLGEARLTFRATTLGDAELAKLARAAQGAAPLEPREFLHGRPRARVRPPRPEDERAADLALLGLGAGASPDLVRRTFKRLVLAHHPDRAQTEADRRTRNAELAKLAAAYSRLVRS
jgi:hypothetical protein